MKNIISILLLSIIILGCNEQEFLSEAPISSINSLNFYNTSDEFNQAVNSAYTSLQPLYGGRNWQADESAWVFAELRSDNTTVQYDVSSRAVAFMERVDQFLMQSSNGVVNSAWQNAYIGIAKCNTVLHFIEDKEVENKDRYVAEAKFYGHYTTFISYGILEMSR